MPALLHSILLLSTAIHNPAAPPADQVRPVKVPAACAAVTRLEVEEALGRRLGVGREEREAGGSSCDFAAGEGLVTIAIHRSRQDLDLAAETAALRAALPEASLREASGFGVRAFFVDLGGAGTQLHLLRGGREHVMVSILGFGGAREAALPAARIARKILARL